YGFLGDNEPERVRDIVVIFDDEEALIVAFEEFAEGGSDIGFQFGILACEDPIEEVIIAGFVNNLFEGIGIGWWHEREEVVHGEGFTVAGMLEFFWHGLKLGPAVKFEDTQDYLSPLVVAEHAGFGRRRRVVV